MSIARAVRSARCFLCAAPLWALFAGCGVPQSPAMDDSDVELVPEGKEDNYFSSSANEYWVDGSSRVVLEASYANKADSSKLARAKELAQLKTIAIGWFLNVRLTDKEVGDAEHSDANASSYPGYHAIVRTGDWTISDVRALADGVSYSFKVRLQVAGQKTLITKLPGTALSGGKKRFTLQMGVVSNDDLARTDPEHEWFRDEPFDSGKFDPTKLTAAQLEPIDLTISLQDAGDDAYFDLKKLYTDGKLTIDAHYGWDYWDRYDLANAQDLYDRLTASGYKSPSTSWEKYRGESGPLTRTVTIDGQAIEIGVRIFHGSGKGTVGFDPGTDADGVLWEQAMYDSLAKSDVIIFSGHSGQYYGFALSDWTRTGKGVLDYPQLAGATMPKDHYQVVLASGCNTFSIGEAFRNNPNKPDLLNLNVVTTNTFSNAGTNEEVMAVLDAIDGGDAAKFSPKPISTMLKSMNGSGMGSMFGVHGTDHDPKLHPFARLDTLGKACTANADCGGEGNRCTKVSTKRVCSATCLEDAACPSSYRCRSVAATGSSTIVGKQCLK